MQITKAFAILASALPLTLAAPAAEHGKPLPYQCPVTPSASQPPAQRNPALKITIPIHKLDEISNEEFDRHWSKCDIPLALDCPAFRDNVVKFAATHNTPELRAELAALGYPMLDYDGIIEFYVKNLDDWKKVTASDCWQIVRKDAQTFSKWPFQFMYGYEEIALNTGSSPF